MYTFIEANITEEGAEKVVFFFKIYASSIIADIQDRPSNFTTLCLSTKSTFCSNSIQKIAYKSDKIRL